MSADQLRREAEQRQQKFRFQAVYEIILFLIFFIYAAWNVARVHAVVPRMGWGLLSLWCIYFAYQRSKRFWRGQPAPATLNTTLQSYRSELEKRRDYARHVWRKAGLTYCFLGMALVIAPILIKSLDDPRRLLLKFGPLFVLLAVWCAIFFPKMKRQRQKLQREIEELLVFEREGRS
ncbi:MAG: hypothetical protein WAM04_06650 [Candidatus Sulfotelmatobacter sp.]